MRTLIVLGGCLFLLGCSAPRCHRRGWVGGELTEVCASVGLLDLAAPACVRGKVIGMPRDCRGGSGLLVVRAGPSSPLARAGLAEGDLITAVDGRPVADPLTFREEIEAKPPGSVVVLDAWRAGSSLRTTVLVGQEVYQRRTTLGLFLGASPHVDLWPFDDGIDVLGVLVVKTSSRRHDLETPERCYLASARPGEEPPPLMQETLRVRVLPLLFGRETLVRRQDAVPVPAAN